MSGGRFGTGLPSFRQGRLVSCSTYTCVQVECKVKAGGLAPGKGLPFTLGMTFKAEAAANEDANRFAVRTVMQRRTPTVSRDYVYETTEFYSVEAALLVMVTAYWPYALGIFIGLLLLLALILALWKSNAFSKMRVFKKQMDEEEKRDRQSVRAAQQES